MTREKYMALADLQTIWTGKLKPWVVEQMGLLAKKSEMSVTNGTGSDADKVTIQLKNGTSTTVLKSHQDVSTKVDESDVMTKEEFDELFYSVFEDYQ